jgi:hypothetical protein
MTIDDRAAREKASELEKMLEDEKYDQLHNQLVELATDKDSFNKIMSTFDEINQQRRANGHPELPDVEIHRDGWFGFGNVDQVILNGVGEPPKKMEIFETWEHRQAEEAENARQSEPLHIDLGRLWDVIRQNKTWIGDTPDFHTDSSRPKPEQTIQAPENPAPPTIRDFRNDTRVGALEMPGARRMTEEELERYLKGGSQ